MHRFYLESITTESHVLLIDDPEEVQHIVHVLRLAVEDEVELINGRGLLARVRLTAVSKRGVEGEIVESRQFSRPNRPRIVLACAMPKRSRFDEILEKSTELGVDEVIPMITERTEIVPSKNAITRMDSRMVNIIVNASKQCKRMWFPFVHQVMPFEEVVDQFSRPESSLFIAWLGGERRALRDAFTPDRTGHGVENSVVFLVGPEGDFTSGEAAYAVNKGAVPLSLGDTVLRVETAAITVVSFARIMMS